MVRPWSRIAPACLAVACGLIPIGTPPEDSQRSSSPLPSPLDSYLATTVKPTAAERNLLVNGRPITKLLDTDASNEVAVFGAVWIAAPIRRYVDAVKDIEHFERGGGFTLTRRISSPPRRDDFALWRLSDDDVRDLRTCRVGDCELKLGEKGLQAFRTEVNWNGPGAHAAAEAVMRRLAFEYVTGYLEGGNERLAVYRDKSRPLSVAEEFQSMVRGMPALTTYLPDMRRYLLGFPDAQVPDVTSFLVPAGDRIRTEATIRINHLTIHEGADETVVASKMLYASHYFWTALELRVLRPASVTRPGILARDDNRSRSDGLSGLTGIFVRRRVRSEAVRGVMAVLEATKRRLEQTHEPARHRFYHDGRIRIPNRKRRQSQPSRRHSAPQTIPGDAPMERPTARHQHLTTPHAGAHVPRPIPHGTASTRAAGWIRGRRGRPFSCWHATQSHPPDPRVARPSEPAHLRALRARVSWPVAQNVGAGAMNTTR